jgi:Flp pilus assembly protein TadG
MQAVVPADRRNDRSPPAHTPPGGRRRGNRCGEGGYSTVEAVLLLPILVACTLMVVQFALVGHARSLAQSAARVGTDAARAYTATDADGHQQARAYLEAVDPGLLPRADIDVTRTATSVQVHIRAQVLAVAGIPFTVDIDERSSGPWERFVGGPDAR